MNVMIENADLLKVGKDLTRREKFAMAAMQGFLANSYSETTTPMSTASRWEIAEMSVQQADALIKELDKEV